MEATLNSVAFLAIIEVLLLAVEVLAFVVLLAWASYDVFVRRHK